MLTNMGQYLAVPYIAPAVEPDDPNTGVPSDHDMAVAEPLAGADCVSTREYTVRTSRPLPESGILGFGEWLQGVQWEGILTCDLSPTQQAESMERILLDRVEHQFPTKSVQVSNGDFAFIMAEIKKLDKYVKREYKLRGKTVKYFQLKAAYDQKFKKAAADHLQKFVRDMKEQAPGKAYRAMRRMGSRPGDCDDEGSFTLTEHINSNLTPQQSVEKIAQYFSAISQEYPPLVFINLPQHVQLKLSQNINICDIPVIEPYQVWEKNENL